MLHASSALSKDAGASASRCIPRGVVHNFATLSIKREATSGCAILLDQDAKGNYFPAPPAAAAVAANLAAMAAEEEEENKLERGKGGLPDEQFSFQKPAFLQFRSS
jgi:hypothetical protein